MIDLKLLRQNPDHFRQACQAKGMDPALIDQLLKVDQTVRHLTAQADQLRAQRNQITEKLKTKKDNQLVAKASRIKQEIKKIESQLAELRPRLKQLLFDIPNPPAADVKTGKDESENEVIKTWGKKPQFDFTPLDHLALGEKLDLIDVKRAAKVSGSRFGYLKNELVLLEVALVRYAFDQLLKEGFTPVIPPVMVKEEAMQAMGYLEHGGENETYHFKKDKLYLVGTSEQSLGPMHANEVFAEKDLPRRYVGFSTCFRREAGSYGKDTRGIFRVHQFDKMEMFVFARPQDSDKEHHYLLSLEEKLVQALKLPYRVVKMCSGDLGHPAARKYDIECWFPGQNRYRETHSVSTCTDFQARRLNIKYQSANDNQLHFVHTLNGTYFAPRLILAILENYQQKDGSVKVPSVLQPYLDLKVIKPKS